MLLYYYFLLTIIFYFVKTCEGQIQESIHKPWYESLPAVAMDYKVHIDAGKEDCYYQYVQPGATFYVAFSVSSYLKITI